MLPLKDLKKDFNAHFNGEASEYYFSPGRINLIGEHIDYNGGNVLPAAISLGIVAAVNRREDQHVRIYSKDYNDEASFDLSTFSADFQQGSEWPDYIKAMLMVLNDNRAELDGADILLASDLPVGSGLSSSASIECLIGYIFNKDFYEDDRTRLALDAQHAERHYVGVNCGIMDQFAIANGKSKNAMLLNCSTLEFEYIPATFKNYNLVIINSNKSRALADSKYNERRRECERAYAILSRIDPAEDLCHVHEISLAQLQDDVLYRRAKHAVLENKRVLHAVHALKAGNIDAFGHLLIESHESLDKDYEVTGPELNAIVHYSTRFEGCAGARMTGAGFGGCCIALVENGRVEKFISYVGKKYKEKTGLKADFYLADIFDGVKEIVAHAPST
jgi:galactokinase